MEFKRKTNTHVIYKWRDLVKAFDQVDLPHRRLLEMAFQIIDDMYAQMRRNAGKDPSPDYLIVNYDEPYAEEVLEVIKRGEEAKEGMKR